MKKIGVISDVHGNLPALVAALQYLDKQCCDEIIHTGDVVDIGPDAPACMQLLLSRGVICLLGNHDKDFLLNDSKHRPFSHVIEAHKRYVFDSLDGYRDEVAKFPLFVTRRCGGQTIMFEHYCRLREPDENGDLFVLIEQCPTAEFFDEIYSDYHCDAVFFGHKHEPCDVRGQRLYVDVGSVGCHPDSYARGIIIEYDDASWSYRRFATPYDLDSVRKQMEEGPLPDGKYLYDFYFAKTVK